MTAADWVSLAQIVEVLCLVVAATCLVMAVVGPLYDRWYEKESSR
jgi:putative effector of murein hydrolase LrgA (UPF0299 family)